MAMRFGVIVVVLSAMMAFQNCARAPGESQAASTAASPSTQKVEAKSFFFNDDYGRVGTGTSELVLNVDTGEIALSSAVEQPVQASLGASMKYCLDEDERAELESLLTEDQVCAADKSAVSSDQVCTAVYRPSYAKYGSQTQSIVAVGEAVSGCQVKADFCSGHGDRIRQMIEQVKATLDSRSCSSL